MDLIIFNPPRYKSGRHHKANNSLLWIASYLHKRGIGVRIVPLAGGDFEEVVEAELTRYQPKFVAVSCKWWDTLYSSTYIASLVKRIAPNVVTVTGGWTASVFADEIVAKTDFDAVICGDGEEPLYRLVSGQPPLNTVTRGVSAAEARRQHVQTALDFESIALVEDLENILSDLSVLDGYVWTGKGCIEKCVYCAANSWNNRKSYGRFGYAYRPLDTVVRDVEILARYPSVSRFTFNFDPIRGPVQENYHLDLISSLPKKKLNCYFGSWGLPSLELVDALAESFNFVELVIDIQCASERLRKTLGDRGMLKPYFSDEALEEVLCRSQQHDNMMIDLSTLIGLPFEQDEDRDQFQIFSDYFYDRYENVRYPYVSPMNVEPGAMILRDPDSYDMVLFRRTFDDFLTYTRRSFEKELNCYRPEVYSEGLFHPLGCASKQDVAAGQPFRVYEQWQKIQAYADMRTSEKAPFRVARYRKFGLLEAGISGGIEKATSGTVGEFTPPWGT